MLFDGLVFGRITFHDPIDVVVSAFNGGGVCDASYGYLDSHIGVTKGSSQFTRLQLGVADGPYNKLG